MNDSTVFRSRGCHAHLITIELRVSHYVSRAEAAAPIGCLLQLNWLWRSLAENGVIWLVAEILVLDPPVTSAFTDHNPVTVLRMFCHVLRDSLICFQCGNACYSAR